jgi:hypothetical protein
MRRFPFHFHLEGSQIAIEKTWKVASSVVSSARKLLSKELNIRIPFDEDLPVLGIVPRHRLCGFSHSLQERAEVACCRELMYIPRLWNNQKRYEKKTDKRSILICLCLLCERFLWDLSSISSKRSAPVLFAAAAHSGLFEEWLDAFSIGIFGDSEIAHKPSMIVS